MKTATAPEICDAFMNSFIGYFGTPIRIVCDQDPAFMSHLTQWFLHAYGIHVTTARPTNHQSLMAEHCIKSLANILMKHLTGLGENWLLYCKPAMLVYNSLQSPTKNAPGTPNETPLEERIVELTETLYQMDFDGRPVQKPFKPFLTQPRRKFRRSFDKGCSRCGRHLHHPDK